MKIRDYIQNKVFGDRASKHGALVVYDAARRYRAEALALATPKCRVIDAGASIIVAREETMRALRDLAGGAIDQLVVWLPNRRPPSLPGNHSRRVSDKFGR
jgi:hypothetical protein